MSEETPEDVQRWFGPSHVADFWAVVAAMHSGTFETAGSIAQSYDLTMHHVPCQCPGVWRSRGPNAHCVEGGLPATA